LTSPKTLNFHLRCFTTCTPSRAPTLLRSIFHTISVSQLVRNLNIKQRANLCCGRSHKAVLSHTSNIDSAGLVSVSLSLFPPTPYIASSSQWQLLLLLHCMRTKCLVVVTPEMTSTPHPMILNMGNDELGGKQHIITVDQVHLVQHKS